MPASGISLGGGIGTYERVIQGSQQSASQELQQQAQQIGTNAIVGIDLDFESVGGKGSIQMVVATGTAVRVLAEILFMNHIGRRRLHYFLLFAVIWN